MQKTLLTILFLLLGGIQFSNAQQRILIPMDGSQTNHLKAYGILFNHLLAGESGQWLLNYRGGSFLTVETNDIVRQSRLRNVHIERIDEVEAVSLIEQAEEPGVNMAVVQLESAPKIAVYTPPRSLPWDDAVTLALDYAEVPYDRIYDQDVLSGELQQYDWLHLHHEDFTGQFGKFYAMYRNAAWYIDDVRRLQTLARELGYSRVSELKLAVAMEIQQYVGGGGYLFAMCSGTNTLDIALAAAGLDIVPPEIDGTPLSPNVNERLDYNRTFAFENFTVNTNAYIYEHGNIDITVELDRISESIDYFTLFEFSAKWDPVPSMLTQNHVSSIKGFYGQNTAFRKETIKSNVVILGESPGRDQVKYLHGNYGEGTFTFYSGHDPEDYTHRINDPPTDLDLFPNSPGYRLILNNILFPAAQEQQLET
ncbi:MAG: asparagine synthetase B [Balneolaceae bacterium]